MVVPNSYALLLQSEIIVYVLSCINFAVLNAALIFYQWLLYPDYHFIFTIVTHCGQKSFYIPVIKYINSVVYVQHEIDNILWDIRP